MGNITQKWVKILVPFASGYDQKFTESELSKLSKIPQQTASRHLNNLVKKNLVSYERQGRNKLFYIDLKMQTAFTLLQIIENYKSLEFQQKVNEASVAINELSSCAESIIVFGSYSLYKFDEDSDLDLIAAGKSDKRRIKAIKLKYPIGINEHYVSYKELTVLLKKRNPLALEVLKNHILFGNTSKIVHIFMRYFYVSEIAIDKTLLL